MLALGTTIYTKGHGHLTIGEKLGDGLEGVVYDLAESSDLVVKVWKTQHTPPHAVFVVETIAALTKNVPGVAEVIEPIYMRPGAPACGCLVQRVHGVPLYEKKWKGKRERKRAAGYVSETILELHRRGGYHGDSHPGNWIVCGKTGRPTAIDCDSLSFGEVLWPDGKMAARHVAKGAQQFTPPWLWKKADVVHDEKTASHALALLLWLILRDAHPAQCVDVDGRELPVEQTGLLELQWGRFGGQNGRHSPVDYGVPFAKLPERLQWLFERAFEEPTLRHGGTVPLKEWAKALGAKDPTETSRWTRPLTYGGLTAIGVSLAVMLGIWLSERDRKEVSPTPATTEKTAKPILWREGP